MRNLSLIVISSLFINSLSWAEDCISRESDLNQNEKVSQSIVNFGGIDELMGTYRLSGFLGSLTDVKIKLISKDQKFMVRVNNDDYKDALICSQDVNNKRKHALQIKVLKPKFPENGLILIRPSEKGGLFVSAHKSRWKFMKFKKISEQDPMLAMDQNSKK